MASQAKRSSLPSLVGNKHKFAESKSSNDVSSLNDVSGTPSGETFTKFLARIEKEFGLRAEFSSDKWPSSHVLSEEEKTCRKLVRRLWFCDQPLIYSCVEQFRRMDPSQRTLSDLNSLLESEQSPRHRATASRRSIRSDDSDFAASAGSPDRDHERRSKLPLALKRSSLISSTASAAEKASFQYLDHHPDHALSAKTSFTSEVSEEPVQVFSPSTSQDGTTSSAQWPSTQTSSFENGCNSSKINSEDSTSHSMGTFLPSLSLERTTTTEAKLEPYYVRDLPYANLFCDSTLMDIDIPFNIRYEVARIALAAKISASDINKWCIERNANWTNRNAFVQDLNTLHSSPCTQDISNSAFSASEVISSGVWEAANNPAQVSYRQFKGTLAMNSGNTGSPFELSLKPLAISEKSNRFYRKYGAHRFLKITIPSEKTIGLSKGNQLALKERLDEWLTIPDKKFLGCEWTVIFHKPSKARKKTKLRFKDDDARTITLFATRGPGLEVVTIQSLLGWFMNFDLNMDMFSCKAFSRLGLGFSATYATITFKPSQIRQKPDIFGNEAKGHHHFEDPNLDWYDIDQPNEAQIMNDGCARISSAAASKVWKSLNHSTPVPSAFQARIGPAKGVWFVWPDETVWIEMVPSQVKFRQHIEDLNDLTFDPARLTFEVLKWTRAPGRSALFLDYIPILDDRGVTLKALADVVNQEIQLEGEEASDVLESPVALLRWLQQNTFSAAGFPEGVEWYGKKPKSLAAVAKSLIYCGFTLQKSPYLRLMATKLMENHFTRLVGDLKLPLPESTMLIGVADPTQVLAPDEIHVGFSTSKLAGQPFLDQIDVLVSRNPALRNSDIQKVKAIFRPELKHLLDVVVFPSTGNYPLAAKLQGGDYDGDTFWICWNQSFVEPFKNAPSIPFAAQAESYGIQVDTTKIREIDDTDSESRAQLFLSHNLVFQSQPSFLGQMTDLYEKTRYLLNTLREPRLESILNIHDLLVDSTKNGYIYTRQAYDVFQKSLGLPPLQAPLYKTQLGAKLDEDVFSGRIKSVHVIDRLILDVARNACREQMKHVQRTIEGMTEQSWDNLLVAPMKKAKQNFKHDREICEMLKSLEESIKKSEFYEPWRTTSIMINETKPDENQKSILWDGALRECRHLYEKILPCNPESSAAKMFLFRIEDHAPSHWEQLRASALYKVFHQKEAFIHAIAGEEICFIRGFSARNAAPVVPTISCHLKVGKMTPDRTYIGDVRQPEKTYVPETDNTGSDETTEIHTEGDQSGHRENKVAKLHMRHLSRGSVDDVYYDALEDHLSQRLEQSSLHD